MKSLFSPNPTVLWLHIQNHQVFPNPEVAIAIPAMADTYCCHSDSYMIVWEGLTSSRVRLGGVNLKYAAWSSLEVAMLPKKAKPRSPCGVVLLSRDAGSLSQFSHTGSEYQFTHYFL